MVNIDQAVSQQSVFAASETVVLQTLDYLLHGDESLIMSGQNVLELWGITSYVISFHIHSSPTVLLFFMML